MILVVKDILAGILNPYLLLSQHGRVQSGNDQHLPSEHLQPLVGDIVIYLNSDDKTSYRLITEILTKN